MKRIFLMSIIFISYNINTYSLNLNFPKTILSQNFFLNFNNNITFDTTNDNIKKENPILKDIDFSWFKEKYRVEKILIASGIITMTIGLPIVIVGIVNYFLPLADKSNISDITSFSLIGIGSGLFVCGGILTVVWVIRLNILKDKERKVSFTFSGISFL